MYINVVGTNVCSGLLKPTENPMVKAQLHLFYLYSLVLSISNIESPKRNTQRECVLAKFKQKPMERNR